MKNGRVPPNNLNALVTAGTFPRTRSSPSPRTSKTPDAHAFPWPACGGTQRLRAHAFSVPPRDLGLGLPLRRVCVLPDLGDLAVHKAHQPHHLSLHLSTLIGE